MTQPMIELSLDCMNCDNVHKVTVPIDDFKKYEDGAYIQDAFPYLEPEIRELFISHICPKCWNEMFPPELDEY